MPHLLVYTHIDVHDVSCMPLNYSSTFGYSILHQRASCGNEVLGFRSEQQVVIQFNVEQLCPFIYDKSFSKRKKKKEHLKFSVTPGSKMKHLHKETRSLNESIFK